jgi:hypothetical protein
MFEHEHPVEFWRIKQLFAVQEVLFLYKPHFSCLLALPYNNYSHFYGQMSIILGQKRHFSIKSGHTQAAVGGDVL